MCIYWWYCSSRGTLFTIKTKKYGKFPSVHFSTRSNIYSNIFCYKSIKKTSLACGNAGVDTYVWATYVYITIHWCIFWDTEQRCKSKFDTNNIPHDDFRRNSFLSSRISVIVEIQQKLQLYTEVFVDIDIILQIFYHIKKPSLTRWFFVYMYTRDSISRILVHSLLSLSFSFLFRFSSLVSFCSFDT